MRLLGEVQKYGQPPPELMQQLMPGLTFDEHGQPVMPEMPMEMGMGMGSGMGLGPMAGGMDPQNPNCLIM